MKLSELHDPEELFGYEFVTDACKREPEKLFYIATGKLYVV